MSRDLGRCSLCRRPAERGAVGKWWHLGPSCMSRSIIIAQPSDWEPAYFIPDNTMWGALVATGGVRR